MTEDIDEYNQQVEEYNKSIDEYNGSILNRLKRMFKK